MTYLTIKNVTKLLQSRMRIVITHIAYLENKAYLVNLCYIDQVLAANSQGECKTFKTNHSRTEHLYSM